MKFLKQSFLAATLFFLLAFSAHAFTYTLNLSAASAVNGGTAVADIENVAKITFIGTSFIGFTDNDVSGGISADDTFDEYFVIRATSFVDALGNDITPDTHGVSWDLTLMGVAEGIQTTDNTYALTDMTLFDFIFDSGDNYTDAINTDLSTYSDGTVVEDGDLIIGGGTNKAGIISGTFDLVADLNDLLHLEQGANGEFFEVDENGDAFPMEFVLGIVDSNNTEEANDENEGVWEDVVTAFETEFNFDKNSYDFYSVGSNDGSLTKAIVPEPTTMLLLGVGLLGIAGVSRRKQY